MTNVSNKNNAKPADLIKFTLISLRSVGVPRHSGVFVCVVRGV